jgi:hypothetical protein
MVLEMLQQVYDPNVFLAFRFVGMYPAVQVFPKPWMKNAYVIFTLVQFAIDYKMEDYQFIAALNPFIIAVFLFGIFPGYFYFLFQKSTNDNGIWLSIALYIFIVVAARMSGFGFPADDPTKHMIQLKDPVYNAQHLVLNCIMTTLFYLPYMMFYNPRKAKNIWKTKKSR